MQLTCSPVYSISLFTFNFTIPLPEAAYTWTTPDYRGLENRPRDHYYARKPQRKPPGNQLTELVLNTCAPCRDQIHIRHNG